MNILWIDNDREYIEPYVEDIRDFGHSVKRLYSPEAGLDHLIDNHSRYDLILIDVMMPSADPRFMEPEAQEGKRSGIILIERLLQIDPALRRKIKVINILTEARIKSKIAEYAVKFFIYRRE